MVIDLGLVSGTLPVRVPEDPLDSKMSAIGIPRHTAHCPRLIDLSYVTSRLTMAYCSRSMQRRPAHSRLKVILDMSQTSLRAALYSIRVWGHQQRHP